MAASELPLSGRESRVAMGGTERRILSTASLACHTGIASQSELVHCFAAHKWFYLPVEISGGVEVSKVLRFLSRRGYNELPLSETGHQSQEIVYTELPHPQVTSVPWIDTSCYLAISLDPPFPHIPKIGFVNRCLMVSSECPFRAWLSYYVDRLHEWKNLALRELAIIHTRLPSPGKDAIRLHNT